MEVWQTAQTVFNSTVKDYSPSVNSDDVPGPEIWTFDI